MSLSCSCEYEPSGEFGEWWWMGPHDFTTFEEYRRKRCSSCNDLIDIGSLCLPFERWRTPYTEIEERISGEEILMSPLYLCESCGEIYLNLDDIGICVDITKDVREDLKEYHRMTGFKIKA